MKKLSLALLTVVMLFSVTSLFAQGKYGADSANCVKYLNFYRDYYRQNNYQEAAGLWRKAMENGKLPSYRKPEHADSWPYHYEISYRHLSGRT